MTDDEFQAVRSNFESLCMNHNRRMQVFMRGVRRLVFVERLGKWVRWINVPFWLAHVFMLLDTGITPGSLFLSWVIVGNLFIGLLAFLYQERLCKRLSKESDELDCSTSLIHEFIERYPYLHRPSSPTVEQ